MIILFAIQPVMALAWIGTHLTLGGTTDTRYQAVMVATVVTTAVLAVSGRFPLLWTCIATACAAIPPAAPLVLCHVCAHVMVHQARRFGDGDSRSEVCSSMARRWLRVGGLAAAMGVVLLYYWWDAWDRARVPSLDCLLRTDPLRLMNDAFSSGVRGVLFVAAAWYALQFLRTARLLLQLRSTPVESE